MMFMKDISYFTGVGYIQYNPSRPGMKAQSVSSGRKNHQWWCILKVDREITRYYRWWIGRRYWGQTAIQSNWICQPSWDAHVSIVRGETPRVKNHWQAYNGEKVEFQYAHYPRQTTIEDRQTRHAKDGDFWFVDVICPRITEIRQELGLRTFSKSHLTVGRTYDSRF